MIKIAVAGAEGRMGRLITQQVEADPHTELTSKITHKETSQFPEHPTDIFIDFSHVDAVLNHAERCAERNISMVIGVTGLSTEQISALRTISKHLPIILSPNMSLGVNLSFKLLEIITRLLKEKEKVFDIAITETHHHHKKDAPSGTAKRMGEVIASELGTNLAQSGIQFSSLRLGEVMGDHRAMFAFGGEQLEITHKAEDRIIFAKGALLAAKWLYGKPPGLYDMQDVLGL